MHDDQAQVIEFTRAGEIFKLAEITENKVPAR